MEKMFIGVDLGGTKTALGLAGQDLSLIHIQMCISDRDSDA